MGNPVIWQDKEGNYEATTFGPGAFIYWVQTVISGIHKLVVKL